MGADRKQLPKIPVRYRFSRLPHYDMRRHLRGSGKQHDNSGQSAQRDILPCSLYRYPLFLPVQIRRTGEVDILRALAACQGQGGDFQSEAAKIRPDLDADNPHIIRAGKGHIETVFIKRRDGGTVCVSTQVGCSVGCIFCESGRNGFVRNLTPSEIVQQVVLIRQKVNRIVFMGMGEPLFNYDNLIAAIHILRDRNGLNFPTDGITVSTVGPVNQLKKLREEHLKIQLTISLHAATQAARNCIIPHMHMYAIEDVVKQALSYSQRHNRKVVFAYLLLPGINDRSSDIRQLAKWFKGKNVMINVLQYNPTSNSKIRAPQKQEMVAFKHQLEQTGLEVTMRVSHGREIKAACGQLANTYNKAKKQQK